MCVCVWLTAVEDLSRLGPCDCCCSQLQEFFKSELRIDAGNAVRSSLKQFNEVSVSATAFEIKASGGNGVPRNHQAHFTRLKGSCRWRRRCWNVVSWWQTCRVFVEPVVVSWYHLTATFIRECFVAVVGEFHARNLARSCWSISCPHCSYESVDGSGEWQFFDLAMFYISTLAQSKALQVRPRKLDNGKCSSGNQKSVSGIQPLISKDCHTVSSIHLLGLPLISLHHSKGI